MEKRALAILPGWSVGLKQRLRSTLGSFWPAPEAASRTANGIAGPARLDRRTKDLCLRLKRGDIAVIDHPDLDGPAAESLVERHPAAVVNAAPSITGRYPNRGP